MLDFESRRIRDLRGIDFSKLEFENYKIMNDYCSP